MRFAAVAAALAMTAGCTGGDRPTSSGSAAPELTVSAEGGVELRYPPAAFPDGVTPRVSVGGSSDAFLTDFATGGPARVVSVTAGAQPAEPVRLALPYQPDAVPAGLLPAVFYHDVELGLWLPVPTQANPADGRLVATVDHFTDFSIALLRQPPTTNPVGLGIDWLSYQVARAVGGRTDPPSCPSAAPPWVTRVDTYDLLPRNAPLLACVGSRPAGPGRVEADLRFALNRAYSMEFTLSQPPTRVGLAAPADTDSVLAQVVAARLARLPAAQSILVPARATARIGFAEPPSGTRQITVTGQLTNRSVLIDTTTNALAFGIGKGWFGNARRAQIMDCAVGVIMQLTNDDAQAAPGAWTEIAAKCLEPATATLPPDAPLRRLSGAISTGLLLGRGTLALLEGAGTSRTPHALAIEVAANQDSDGAGTPRTVPADGIPLYVAAVTSTGVGRSGERVSVVLDGRVAADSTSQWVGCDGAPATATYRLTQAPQRLVGTFALRSHTPRDLRVQVRVLGDRRELATWQLDPTQQVPVDIPVADVDELTITARATSGQCTAASSAYGVFADTYLR